MPEKTPAAPHVYRIFHLDSEGRFQNSTVVDADNDENALEIARVLLDSFPIELWDGPRFIGRLEPERS